MEFNISCFSNERVDIENKSKGIAIKKLNDRIYESPEQIRRSILSWNEPSFFDGKDKELRECFEQEIKNLELEIERKKMLINLIKRKVVYFVE